MSSGDDKLQDAVRESLDEADSGAPASGAALHDRFSASEIFQRVVVSGEEEMMIPAHQLFFSGIAAGFAITLTVLAYASVLAITDGPSGELVAPLLYPLGFIFIVVGEYQLYTENTLPPVTLVLTRLASIPSLLRVWSIVIAGNLAGVAVGAYILATTGMLGPAEIEAAESLGMHGLETPWMAVFFKGIFAGWLVAGLVWLDHAMRDSIGRILVIYVIMFTVPTADLFHIITSMGDALFVFFRGQASLVSLTWEFLVPVFLGNTVGGVVPVAVLNYGLTEHHLTGSDAESTDSQGKLSLSEWAFGGLAGRFRLRFGEE